MCGKLINYLQGAMSDHPKTESGLSKSGQKTALQAEAAPETDGSRAAANSGNASAAVKKIESSSSQCPTSQCPTSQCPTSQCPTSQCPSSQPAADDPSAVAASAAQSNSKHFWISTFPFFETTLFLVPPPAPIATTFLSRIDLFDADGMLINQVTLEVPAQNVYVVELDPLLGPCKLEQGIKHAHMVVSTPGAAYCRVQGRENGSLLGEPALVNATRATFFPLTFELGRSNLLCVINRNEYEASLRGRLFVGRRSPEIGWTIPAKASRVFNIETQFSEFIEIEEDQLVRGYVRLSTKAGDIGVQLVERTPGSREHGIYGAMS